MNNRTSRRLRADGGVRPASLIVQALYRAIEWEESLAESWGSDTPEHRRAKDKAEDFRALLKKKGYKEAELTGESVSIQALMRTARLIEIKTEGQ